MRTKPNSSDALKDDAHEYRNCRYPGRGPPEILAFPFLMDLCSSSQDFLPLGHAERGPIRPAIIPLRLRSFDFEEVFRLDFPGFGVVHKEPESFREFSGKPDLLYSASAVDRLGPP